MVGYDQKIQRSIQLDPQPVIGLDFLAAREAIGLIGPDDGTDQARIGGEGCVQVGVAEEHLVGEILIGVGRIIHSPVSRAGHFLCDCR